MNYTDELYHYGVLGMKWGMHRAAKKGTSYTYRSFAQKRAQRKLDKLNKQGLGRSMLANDTAMKLDRLKVRDNNRAAYAKKASVGGAVVKRLIAGPYAQRYERLRSQNIGRGKAALSSLTLLTTKHAENRQVNEQWNKDMFKSLQKGKKKGKNGIVTIKKLPGGTRVNNFKVMTR